MHNMLITVACKTPSHTQSTILYYQDKKNSTIPILLDWFISTWQTYNTTHIHRQTNRQTDGPTDRRTDGPTDRQRQTETDLVVFLAKISYLKVVGVAWSQVANCSLKVMLIGQCSNGKQARINSKDTLCVKFKQNIDEKRGQGKGNLRQGVTL